MFQPFELMKPEFLLKLIRLKRHYLVSQTYKQGGGPTTSPKIDLLMTDYADIGLAKGHFNALQGDRYASVIDLTKPEHLNKIREMVGEESSYRVFWAVVKSKEELERRLTSKYATHMRRYIARNTTWNVSSDKGLRPNLQMIYGDLFLVLKYGHETRRLTFEELEKS